MGPREYGIDVGYGFVAGRLRFAALGRVNNVDTTTPPVDVSILGGFYPWLQDAAVALEIVSTSAQDAASGTGCAVVRIDGLDGNLNIVSFNVTLNGLTPVALPQQLRRVQAMIGLTKGSGAPYTTTNIGDISVRDAGGGTVRARMPAGLGFSSQAVGTVPAGYVGQVLSLFGGIIRAPGAATTRYASVANWFRGTGGIARMPLEFPFSSVAPYRHDNPPAGAGVPVPAGTDIALRCTSVSDNGTNVFGGFLMEFRKLATY